MTGEGRVLSTDGSLAVVEISKSSACGHDCASCGACSNPSYTMTVRNPVSAREGDVVIIESPTAAVLKNCFMLYILPVFLLIGAVLLGEIFALGAYGIFVYMIFFVSWLLLIRRRNRSHKSVDVISAVKKDR